MIQRLNLEKIIIQLEIVFVHFCYRICDPFYPFIILHKFKLVLHLTSSCEVIRPITNIGVELKASNEYDYGKIYITGLAFKTVSSKKFFL